jgi:hypothetical protein
MPIILLGRLRLGGSWFEASPGKEFSRPHLQNTIAKWTGGVAQIVELLFCKCKALSSNSNLTKKIKKKKKQYIETQNKTKQKPVGREEVGKGVIG